MIDQWIKDLILERDAVVLHRHRAEQAYNLAKSPEKKDRFKDQMNDANKKLKAINARLGI